MPPSDAGESRLTNGITKVRRNLCSTSRARLLIQMDLYALETRRGVADGHARNDSTTPSDQRSTASRFVVRQKEPDRTRCRSDAADDAYCGRQLSTITVFRGFGWEVSGSRRDSRANGSDVKLRGQGPRGYGSAARRLPAFEARDAGGVTPPKYR
jgi:hypothetical protein